MTIRPSLRRVARQPWQRELALLLVVVLPQIASSQESTRSAIELAVGASTATAAEATAAGGLLRWTHRSGRPSIALELAAFRNSLPCIGTCADRVGDISEAMSYGRIGGLVRWPLTPSGVSRPRLDGFVGGGVITSRWTRRTSAARRMSNPTTGYGTLGAGVFGRRLGGSASLVGYPPTENRVFVLGLELLLSFRL